MLQVFDKNILKHNRFRKTNIYFFKLYNCMRFIAYG